MPLTTDVLLSQYPKSTITQAGMRDRCRGDVGLRSNNLLTDVDLNAWAVEITNEIAQRFKWYRTATFMDVVAGKKEYAFPQGLISLMEVHHNELPLYPLQVADFTRNYAYWRRQGDGVPLWYYVLGNSGLGLHPTPGTNYPGGLFLAYEALPPPPATDQDGYTVPYGGERAIISGVKLRAAEKDASGEGQRRLQVYTQAHQENMLALERAIESASEGEATVIGADAEPEIGYWNRWLGFDNMRTVAPGPG
jgi:hypothetical protein